MAKTIQARADEIRRDDKHMQMVSEIRDLFVCDAKSKRRRRAAERVFNIIAARRQQQGQGNG